MEACLPNQISFHMKDALGNGLPTQCSTMEANHSGILNVTTATKTGCLHTQEKITSKDAKTVREIFYQHTYGRIKPTKNHKIRL